jgi:hypothetical protein
MILARAARHGDVAVGAEGGGLSERGRGATREAVGFLLPGNAEGSGLPP